MNQTQVVNLRHGDCDVRVDRSSIWGNPYVLKPGAGELEREICVLRYAMHLARSGELLERVGELRGKRLGCWCSPKSCHATVLGRVAMSQNPKQALSLEIERRVRALLEGRCVRTNPDHLRLHVFGECFGQEEAASLIQAHPISWAALEFEEETPLGVMLRHQCTQHGVPHRLVEGGPHTSEAFVGLWQDDRAVLRTLLELFREEGWLVWRKESAFFGVHVSVLEDLIEEVPP